MNIGNNKKNTGISINSNLSKSIKGSSMIHTHNYFTEACIQIRVLDTIKGTTFISNQAEENIQSQPPNSEPKF